MRADEVDGEHLMNLDIGLSLEHLRQGARARAFTPSWPAAIRGCQPLAAYLPPVSPPSGRPTIHAPRLLKRFTG
jgi:hypothetical protein